LGSWGGLTRIRDRNAAIQRAETAYAHGNFRDAAAAYWQAVETLGATDEAVVLNLAHAYARAGQPAEARGFYGRLLTSRQPRVRSVARQQLAVLAAQKGEYAQAVSLLRQSLLADPANASARYDYEALKAYLDRRQQEPQVPEPDNSPNPSPGQPDPQSAENQRGARQGNDRSGQLDDSTQPEDPRNAPQARPDQQGQRDPNRPAGSGQGAAGSFEPGAGNEQAVARGTEPGRVRGLSDAAPGKAGNPSGQAGSEQATLSETQLQTQRERLQQMNLSSGRPGSCSKP
jgi:tetratricopeptide (TPR) repeat protein